MNDDPKGIEDRRRHNFFLTDNEVVDDYIERIPKVRRADALAVYTVLVRHANKNNSAWPSVGYIAEKIGRSKPTVIDSIRALHDIGLLDKEARSRKDGGQSANIYILLPVDKEKGVNTVNRGGKQDLPEGVNTVNTKNTKEEEEITSTNVDEGEAQNGQVIPLDKNITDELYNFLKTNGIRWDQDEYGFHLGRVQDMLKHDKPTDVELEDLPRELLKLYAVNPSKADAPKALRQMRRNGIREEVVGEWERERREREEGGPPKKPRKSEEQLAREDAEREEVMRIFAKAQKEGIQNE
jgi:predicted transcriptional regulator